jgi:hypothetical protein
VRERSVRHEVLDPEVVDVPDLVDQILSPPESGRLERAGYDDPLSVDLHERERIADRLPDLVAHLGAPDGVVVKKEGRHGERGILTGRPLASIARFASSMENFPQWKTEAARAASAEPRAGSTASARCSGSPAPPEAITGHGTAQATAAVRPRS